MSSGQIERKLAQKYLDDYGKNRQEVRQGISDSEIDTFKRVLIQINKNMNPENGRYGN